MAILYPQTKYQHFCTDASEIYANGDTTGLENERVDLALKELNDKSTNLENKNELKGIWEEITGTTTGTITTYNNLSINQKNWFEGQYNAKVVSISILGEPQDEAVYSSTGAKVQAIVEIDGTYTLNALPTASRYAIVWQLIGTAKDFGLANIPADKIIEEFDDISLWVDDDVNVKLIKSRILDMQGKNIKEINNILAEQDSVSEIGSPTKALKDVYFRDENGTLSSLRGIGANLRRLEDGTAILKCEITYETIDDNGTPKLIATLSDLSGIGVLAFVVNEIVIVKAQPTLTLDITSYAGTDLNPYNIWHYITNNGLNEPQLNGSNTNPHGIVKYAPLSLIKAGTVSLPETKIVLNIITKVDNFLFLYNVAERFLDEGPVYQSGFETVSSPTDLTIESGTTKVIFNEETTDPKTVSVDGVMYIKYDGTYNFSKLLDFGGVYSDGDLTNPQGFPIGNNKFFNVTFGILNQGSNAIIHALVQKSEGTEYVTLLDALKDDLELTVSAPSDRELAKTFLAVARGIVKKSGLTYELQLLPNGKYHDLPKTGGVVGSTPVVTTFTGLTDTISNYTGRAKQVLIVNDGETAVDTKLLTDENIDPLAGINATKLADGSVDNTNLQNINNLDQKVSTNNSPRFNDLALNSAIDDRIVEISSSGNKLLVFKAKNTAYNKNYGNVADTVCQGNDPRLSDSRTCNNTFDDVVTSRANLSVYSINEVDVLLSQLDTDDIDEGLTNKYYSSTLFDADFNSKTTDNLTEGVTNKYYSSVLFNTDFATKTTSDLTEGTNLYYTETRVSENSSVVASINHINSDGKDHDDVRLNNSHRASTSNPHNIVFSQIGAVGVTTDQTINGVKTFGSFPITPPSAPTSDYQVANKKYVDDSITDKDTLPFVSAEITSLVSNFTGAGPFYTFIFNTNVKDQTGIYNSSTGVTTITKAGWYRISGNLWLRGITSNHTSGIGIIQYSLNTDRRYFDGNPANLRSSANDWALPFDHTIELAVGETVSVGLTIINGTQTVDIGGSIVPSNITIEYVRGI